ncbi:hypothetical protein ACJJIW_21150 [Microbulbifer sp. JMSA004]|uniref:hypothetical protein n=1 Tax=unclassified Microbulbifer TaxID=2619833 RepID=UPI0024ADAA5C|nr:hypothetical protein [Microbulbifer sp. VAAF005]WHI46374.1 hypothetical protein P0078_22085 [Microbulbifer sp. VAAF005]
MKGLLTPAALFAVVIGYVSCEGISLAVSDRSAAYAVGIVLSESDDQSVDYNQYSGDAQDIELFDGSHMMEFEGDVFADAPEHMPPVGEGSGAKDGDEKGFGE